MPLTLEQADMLDKMGAPNVRQRLQYAGAGDGSVVPGLGNSQWISRGDVEEWLAERDREAFQQQADTLWYAKAAFWATISVGVVGIIVTILTAFFGK